MTCRPQSLRRPRAPRRWGTRYELRAFPVQRKTQLRHRRAERPPPTRERRSRPGQAHRRGRERSMGGRAGARVVPARGRRLARCPGAALRLLDPGRRPQHAGDDRHRDSRRRHLDLPPRPHQPADPAGRRMDGAGRSAPAPPALPWQSAHSSPGSGVPGSDSPRSPSSPNRTRSSATDCGGWSRRSPTPPTVRPRCKHADHVWYGSLFFGFVAVQTNSWEGDMHKKLSAVTACVVLAVAAMSADAIAAGHGGHVARGHTGQAGRSG
jgi:hypothetical protein